MRLALLAFLLTVSGAQSRAELPYRLHLLDDKERAQPVEIKKEVAPLGVLLYVEGKRLISTCNGFHGKRAKGRGWFITASHCWTPPARAGVYYLAYFSNRSGKLVVTEWSGKPLVFSWREKRDDKLFRFQIDTAALELSSDVAQDWDALELTVAKDKDPALGDRVIVWGYRFEEESRTDDEMRFLRATLEKAVCRVSHEKLPRFRVTLSQKTTSLFSADYYLSHSKQGEAVDKLWSLYLEDCSLSKGLSGALVTDESSEPLGNFHSLVGGEVFDATWTQWLKGQVMAGAEKKRGSALPENAEMAFSFLPASPKLDTRSFALAKPPAIFYGVATWLSPALRRATEIKAELEKEK